MSQKISKEVKLEVLKDIVETVIKRAIKDSNLDDLMLLDIWKELSGVKYDTFDEFCGMVAKVLYNKIYDIVTIKLPEISISGCLFNDNNAKEDKNNG